MKKTTLTLAMVTAVGALTVTGCNAKKSDAGSKDGSAAQLVECYGVSKSDSPLLMPKSMCDQLPSTKQVVVDTNDYVNCYGVAAAGKNDCATASVSCGGKVKTDRAPDAWVSLPKGICENLKDSSTTEPKK